MTNVMDMNYLAEHRVVFELIADFSRGCHPKTFFCQSKLLIGLRLALTNNLNVQFLFPVPEAGLVLPE